MEKCSYSTRDALFPALPENPLSIRSHFLGAAKAVPCLRQAQLRRADHYLGVVQVADVLFLHGGEQAVRHYHEVASVQDVVATFMVRLGDRASAIPLAEAALKIFQQIENPNGATVRDQLTEWQRGEQ